MKITETRRTILDQLGYSISIPLQTIIAATGMPEGTVRGNLRDMRKAGLVDRTAQGWYRPATSISATY